MNRKKGIILVAISAILFGATPILSKMTFSYGSNAIMSALLRSVFSLPFLYAVIKYKKEDIRITKSEAVKITILGVVGTSFTTMALYSAYDYISVGTAMTIHFTYPAVVMLTSVIFLGKKVNKFKVISLILSTIGIMSFLEKGKTGAVLGVALALFSAVTYAFYIIYMDKSGLKNMRSYKLSFYLGAVSAASMLIVGLFMNKITLAIAPIGWLYCILVGLFASVIAISFFQMGVRYIGPMGASMFSLLEPVSSIILGYFVLSETMNLQKIIGCLLIFAALIIYAKSDK